MTVNYRTPQLTVNCLRALADEVKSVPGTRAVVVDNNSGDGSVDTIRTAIAVEAWDEWASVLPSDYNGGYAYGNNLAIRPALQSPNPPAYVLLLNSDAQVRPGALKALVDYLEHHPTVGIVGSAMINPDGTSWSTAFRFPSILSELESSVRLGIVSKLLSNWKVPQAMGDQPQQVDWLPGASMMIRREVFDSIGLMDEEYFLYYEETDFCLQAKRAGWACCYVPESQVMHIAGQSTGVTARGTAPKRLPQYVFDSRRRYFVKNHGFLYAVLTDFVWSLGYSLWSVRRVLQRKPDTDPPYLFSDSLRNSVLFKFVEGLLTPANNKQVQP
ncbi:MAG: glycosyltransferase family 2 protein [Leptolyngbyaceae cyanobacterium bins.302]|nr:glycosyltransferase family 2 protein [Leptolyngbyaceae cyanobacterium bins.302]